MADDPTKRGSPDNDLVSLTQRHEIDGWRKRWNVTEQQLRDAVARVGNSVKKLDQHFGKR